ncbi:trypsin-like serine protease [Plantactinospora sp. S1510]|uniref:Trypsin-like serine protease n=1 Tax=Plantactinospora alkalitolerans TaxID=2789879 RepID=A0ABS0H2N8_9ACTN|nr:trypsin-like serine protease [Plantactinospora alkalitolerans]MBF9132727.1 trypsin-like serine protease [Plantactinospora alkalitolerans]
MKLPIKTLSAAAVAVLLASLVATPVAVAAPDGQVTPETVAPLIVGGGDAAQAYPGIASLRITKDGDPEYHTCTAILIHPFAVAVNAHCVTLANATPKDPGLYTIRIASTDRLAGGAVRKVRQILPHQQWDWGSGGDEVADIAVLRLNAPVWSRPFPVDQTSASADGIRILGWGATTPSGEGPLPTTLQQLDTRILLADRCAAGGISPGELCVDSPGGISGACYGDSGGPALRRLAGRQWAVVGSGSRETDPVCGLKPTIYTDLTHFRSWLAEVTRTWTVPPAATRADDARSSAAGRAFNWTSFR